jgi:hypothetical protein
MTGYIFFAKCLIRIKDQFVKLYKFSWVWPQLQRLHQILIQIEIKVRGWKFSELLMSESGEKFIDFEKGIYVNHNLRSIVSSYFAYS